MEVLFATLIAAIFLAAFLFYRYKIATEALPTLHQKDILIADISSKLGAKQLERAQRRNI